MNTKYFLLAMLFSITATMVWTQSMNRGQRPPGGDRDPSVMVQREKQVILKELIGLTDDQKLLLEGVYEEFGVTIKETMEKARESRDREKMREQMEAVREEKNLLVKDILNAEQFAKYTELVRDRRPRRGDDDSQSKDSRDNQ